MTRQNALKYFLLFYELTQEENWTQLNNTVQYGIQRNLFRLGSIMDEFWVMRETWRDDIQQLLKTQTGSIYINEELLETDINYQNQLQTLEQGFLTANPDLQNYLSTQVTYQIFTINRQEILNFTDYDFLVTEFPEVFIL